MKKLFYAILISLIILPIGVQASECTDACNGDEACITACDVDTGSNTVTGGYDKIYCGDLEKPIPRILPKIVSTVITIVQIATPIVMILFGMIDLLKAVTAGKDDEIKKSQQIFLKRVITGAMVFLIILIVKTAIGLVAPANSEGSMWSCFDCFITNNCGNN